MTVENYISALQKSFVLYKAGRYDVKGRRYLKSLEKYYLVDPCFRRMLLGDRMYCQVSASVLDPAAFQREIRPLLKIPDNYPKYLLTLDELSTEQDGIRQIHVMDFLLSE